MLTDHFFRSLQPAAICLLSVLLLIGLTGPLSIAWGCSACAGPRSNVYVRAHLTIEESALTRLDIRWQMGETLAQSLLSTHDIDKDGKLDSEEKQALGRILNNELRSEKYHTLLVVNGRTLTSLSFENPRLKWQPAALSFRFGIPLEEPVGDGLQLRLITHDPELYMQFYHQQDSVTWNSPACCMLSDNSHLFPKELEMDIRPIAPDSN
ncbi:MAG: DUF1007 family protein [Desulfohalobiaceae bacterium]|nr:DUF1007 family protein [Desulfohalobiaceae bacterium]